MAAAITTASTTVVSIAAFGTWLFKFSPANNMPKGFTKEKGNRLYFPKDYTNLMTKVDTTGA